MFGFKNKENLEKVIKNLAEELEVLKKHNAAQQLIIQRLDYIESFLDQTFGESEENRIIN